MGNYNLFKKGSLLSLFYYNKYKNEEHRIRKNKNA